METKAEKDARKAAGKPLKTYQFKAKHPKIKALRQYESIIMEFYTSYLNCFG